MESNVELIRLEEFVDKLLTKYNQLKSDYQMLQETLRQRDAECAELKNNVFNLSSERTEVSNRVSGLLDRIEQWENEQMGASVDRSDSSASSQGSLFSNDADNKTI